MSKVCSVIDCAMPVPAPGAARGLCSKHYSRWKRHGDPAISLVDRDTPDEVRFWRYVEKNSAIATYRPDLGECWCWIGGKNRRGYGHFNLSRRSGYVLAHRFSYELLVGPIPDGLDLDHLCRVQACVNPAHLEPVTNAENIHRAALARTHCKNGHEFTEENTHIRHNKGGTTRICRACGREAWAKSHPPKIQVVVGKFLLDSQDCEKLSA